MNNNEAANKMEKIIAIWKLSQKSSSKKRKLSIVSLCIYILIGVGVSSLLFWPYSYPQRIKRMNNKSARDCCRLNDCKRNLHSCETRESDKKKVTDIENWWFLLILYSGNVLFRVSKGNSTYVPQLRADIPLVIIDYYREMQTKYKRIFE